MVLIITIIEIIVLIAILSVVIDIIVFIAILIVFIDIIIDPIIVVIAIKALEISRNANIIAKIKKH